MQGQRGKETWERFFGCILFAPPASFGCDWVKNLFILVFDCLDFILVGPLVFFLYHFQIVVMDSSREKKFSFTSFFHIDLFYMLLSVSYFLCNPSFNCSGHLLFSTLFIIFYT